MQTKTKPKPTINVTAHEERAATAFERQVAHLFRRLGYRVHRQPTTHDLGVDLIIIRPGLRAIIQC